MFKNYLMVAWRNMRRNKAFAFINILGLAIGISASMVIFLIIQYHYSFDRFEPDRERLYRIVTDMKFSGSPIHNPGTPSPLGAAVSREISGIEETIPFHEWFINPVVTITTAKGKKTTFRNQDRIILADASYFRMIPYQWIAGSPNSLDQPLRVVLGEERAKAYFPGVPLQSIPGSVIRYDDSVVLTVSGVVKQLTEKSDFTYKEFVSMSTIAARHMEDNYQMTNWNSISSNTQLFVKLKPGNTKAKMEDQLKNLFRKYGKDVYKDENNRSILLLQPFNEMHFSSEYHPLQNEPANKPTLYGLAAVAIFLLMLGCINFINLSTAQASQRAKEIGVRKTMGSSRGQLILQFLNETFLLSLFATLLSLMLVPLLLKVFADFIPTDLKFNLAHQPILILFLLALVMLVSLLSGLYPAFVLSHFKPALVLKNQALSGTANTRRTWLRKGLTVSQFFVAQVFVMATLLMVKQIHFMINKDMGFKKEAIVNVGTPAIFTSEGYSKTDKRRFVALEKLRSLPGIRKISLCSGVPASNGFMSTDMKYNDGKKEYSNDVLMNYGDTNYLPLYHINLLAGRNVEPSDTIREYVINETLLHAIGMHKPSEALNKQLNGMPIVGVIADYNQTSLHAQIRPLAFSANASNSYAFSIELNPEEPGSMSWKKTIAQMKTIFKSVYPDDEFNAEFFDESIAKFYKAEQDISQLLKWATGLAIFISCMGLLGLVLFTTAQRTKEIGVRKVLGASVGQIVSLLSRDFVWLVIISFAIATPVAWYAMHRWLSDFAYRTPQSWWIFAVSGLGLMLIALFTLSVQTIRAASANPVKSLRTE